jgi:crossover junction endodeoxyribonuclease RuvC
VDDEDGNLIYVDCGVFSLPSKIAIEKRLCSFYNKLTEVINSHKPHEIAIEEPFVAVNARSALAIGRAQAIAILAATLKDIPVFRYLPAQVKQQVTDYGGSSKEQVQGMVRIQLGLPDQPMSEDATDALAVAICHIYLSKFNRMIK